MIEQGSLVVRQYRLYKNSSGDEIANVNFFTRRPTCGGQRLCPLIGLPNFYYKYLC